jgi:hypothetical protein
MTNSPGVSIAGTVSEDAIAAAELSDIFFGVTNPPVA